MPYKSEEDLIAEDIRRLVPIVGREAAKKIRAAYLLGDELTRQRIQETVDAIKASIFSQDEFIGIPIKEPPAEEEALAGDIELGTVLYDKDGLYPFKLKESDLLTHLGIFGSSGSGKTNLARVLVKNLNKKNIPIRIILDYHFSKLSDRFLLFFVNNFPIFVVMYQFTTLCQEEVMRILSA